MIGFTQEKEHSSWKSYREAQGEMVAKKLQVAVREQL